MAGKDLVIAITATDGASATFRKLGDSAKQATQAVDAGSKQAARSVDQLSDSTAKSEAAMKSAESAGKSFAVGIAALGASFALYSRSVVSQQQSIESLRRQYGSAANDFLAFADTVASHSVFNDDEVIAAANSMAVLRREYGLTDTQIQALIQRAADLAALNPGMSLVDAAQRVQAAVRGEAESIEVLGVAVSDSALGIDRMAATTSNAEKASIRYAAIMDQSSFATGAAGDRADTTSGKIARLSNKIDDTAQSFIGMTGPVGEVVGSLGEFSIQAGLALTGVISTAKGVRDLSTAMKGLQAAEGGSALGGLASALGGGAAGGGGLAATLGATATAALAVTAAFTPLIATLIIAKRQADDTMATISEQTDAIDSWSKAISDPNLRQNYIYLAQDIRDFNTAVQDMKTGQVVDVTTALDELLSLNPGDLAKVTEILKANNIEIGNLDPNNIEQLELVYNTIMQVYGEHVAYQQQMAEVAQSHAQAITDLEEQYGSLTPAIEESGKALNSWTLYLMANEIAARKGASAVHELGAGYHELAESADLLLAKAGVQAEQQNEINRILVEAGLATDDYTEKQQRQQQRASEAATTLKGEYADGLRTARTLLPELASDAAGLREQIEQLNSALKDDAGNEFVDGIRRQDQALLDYIQHANEAAKSVGVLSTNAQLFQAAGIKAPSLDVAVNLQTGQGAFDAVFGAIKQAQSMSSSIGGAKSWADELIGDPGTWSELDKLLAEGRISTEQYAAAQAAQVRISEDVGNAQRDLLAVQANLAPTLADAVRQQAEYIDSLSELGPQQQLAALGFMDTAESAKAMQLAQLAAASTTAGMQESTTKMIAAAAEADPVLKAMLLQMGLISETDTGIKVNFDEANSAQKAMEELTKSIDALIVALGGIPPIHTETNAKDTQKDVDGLTDSINNIPDSSTTVIDVLDQASGTIAIVGAQLRALDQSEATVYIRAVQTGASLAGVGAGVTPAGMTGLTISAMATGGTVSTRDIPRYVTGGTHALVGEAGPEMVWLPNGAQVKNAVATESKLDQLARRRAGQGSANFYGPTIFQLQSNDIYDEVRQQSARRGRGT